MISLWEGQIKTFTNQAENLFSQQEMHWLPENIFVSMLALLAFASPSQADLINNTYWVYIPQFSSVAQSCLTLCDSMNCSTPDLPVHHQILEFTQTYIHRVSDAIQPSHPLSFFSPPALNPYHHQSLLQ